MGLLEKSSFKSKHKKIKLSNIKLMKMQSRKKDMTDTDALCQMGERNFHNQGWNLNWYNL